MTLNEARRLQKGARVTAIVTNPTGGESTWNPDIRQYVYDPVTSGQVLFFQEIIPKVCIRQTGPWHDALDEMLLCRTETGKRAWLNIGNAARCT